MKEKKFYNLLYTSQRRESNFLAHLLLSFSILLFALATTSCNNNSVTDVERITGFYEATTFTEPGELDGGVDILANGGMLSARLSSNFKVEGHLIIPENIGSNFAPTDTNYSGAFTLNADTVRFKDTNTLLDYYSSDLMFIVKDNLLETVDWEETGRWWIKIILEKQ